MKSWATFLPYFTTSRWAAITNSRDCCSPVTGPDNFVRKPVQPSPHMVVAKVQARRLRNRPKAEAMTKVVAQETLRGFWRGVSTLQTWLQRCSPTLASRSRNQMHRLRRDIAATLAVLFVGGVLLFVW